MTALSALFSSADILVVDDNPVNVELLMDLLEDEGYSTVEGMTDPLQVEARVHKKRPDLILLDIRMPRISGLELLELLTKQWGEQTPAVIVLTAQIDEATRHQALQLGAQDFLTKPFNHIEVLQRIHNTLQLQRLLSERMKKADLLESLVTERTRELKILSRQDPLTTLPNRHVILETITQLRSEEKELLTFFIALEGLDEMGRLHGYDIMDQALCALSVHVQQLTDLPIRLLGVWSTDKWVVLCESIVSDELAEQIALRLLGVIQAPLNVQQLSVHVRARIGVSGSSAERNAEQMVRMAAVALPAVDSQWQGYDQTLENSLWRKNQLSDALYAAIDNNELHLLYQPKVDVLTGAVRGVEALLRWDNPVFGRVSPAEFIPIAEANCFIVSLGKWVIQQALAAIVRWRAQQAVDDHFTVAVNVASAQLMEPDFAAWLIDTVQQAGLPTHALEVEVTESGLMQDIPLAMRQLHSLAAAGLGIAIDDFGTGYSSLAYLKNLPVSVIKIDRTFVSEMHTNAQDQRLTSTVIDMARHFQFSTVAEGVEEIEQFKLLKMMGCDLIQGFLFAPPLKENIMLQLVSTGFADTPAFTES
ncbi:putative bifunctional diguanylate cyclase/phosphodiesterase [Denitrificimonas caeni]|uniref:putative bifunctional diguanylate cyclase/phosphodiesterase n=1 Tax=Denitrificimonas caeni TaxID=521720 RepID=UPI0019665B31|nr:EAL domain-containing protein [Denitrificimonas caeni]